MAISGTVHVRASVNGGPARPKEHPITVEGRNWSNQSVAHSVRRISSAEFNIVAPPNQQVPPIPTAENQLGGFAGRGVILGGGDNVFDYITDYGPNHGLTLYSRVPVELDLGVTVHPEMENQGVFFRRHPPVNGGAGRFCVQRDFPRYVQLILAHEGLPMNPNSHTGVYLSEYEALAGPAVEDIVFPNVATERMSDVAEARLDAVNLKADSKSDSVVDSPPHEVPFQCNFKWR